MLAAGLVLGALSRVFDIYCQVLGEIFSQMAIWVLLGTLIAIYSPTVKIAMLNILVFCLSMLAAYYAVAIITHGVYAWSYIKKWTVFALFSPVMAYFARLSKRRGVFPKIIALGITAFSLLSSILLFERLRIYDFLIDGLLVYFLFFKKLPDTAPPQPKKQNVKPQQ